MTKTVKKNKTSSGNGEGLWALFIRDVHRRYLYNGNIWAGTCKQIGDHLRKSHFKKREVAVKLPSPTPLQEGGMMYLVFLKNSQKSVCGYR